ncbi:hypothetical protein YC2023_078590 [Brassica napus]|uniref:(rape) hypothetical protein n=1 Tax=Brassica napus TaxID=3708 RepID=A0A816QIG5_BRANA|nr:unnamed protein product [Brassica napus]
MRSDRTMVLVTSVRDYINRMLHDISGMKVLLILDSETVSNVSIVYSQSELLQKEVFLVEHDRFNLRFERINVASESCLLHPHYFGEHSEASIRARQS